MHDRTDNELVVVTRAKGLRPYVLNGTQGVPRSSDPRSSLACRITRRRSSSAYCAPTIALIRRRGDAAALARRSECQRWALTSTKLPCCLALFAMERGCILGHQYEQIARLGFDCQSMLGA